MLFRIVNIKQNTRLLSSMVRHLNQSEAIAVDQELFNEYRFSVDQLMELAGLSCAVATAKVFEPASKPKPLIVVGPGNNGGDGLVCARHLSLFGYQPRVLYPKRSKNAIMKNQTHQVQRMGIQIDSEWNEAQKSAMGGFDFVIDAIFGFSFKPPIREPYGDILQTMIDSKLPVISIDIPSGWNVETGPDPDLPTLKPEVLVSLTAPKLCAQKFEGKHHFLGGRFVPPALAVKYALNLPAYPGTEGVVEL